MPKPPLVSIIMPVFRDKDFVAEAVESILAQDFTDFELLVIDDCGEDGSMAIVQRYRDPRIRIFKNRTNSGPAVSRNVGLDNAKGEYLACMDADDIVETNWLSSQVADMSRHPDLAVLSCNLKLFGLRTESSRCYLEPASVAAALPLDCIVNNGGAFIRKSLLLKTGIRYNDQLRFGIDYQLWADVLTAGLLIKGSGKTLYRYRMREGNISTTKTGPREQLAATIRLRLLANLGFKAEPEYRQWLTRSRPLTSTIPARDLAVLKKLTVELLRLHTPSRRIWRHEVAKFLVSLMPRATGPIGKLSNLVVLAKIDPMLATYFVKGYVLGLRG